MVRRFSQALFAWVLAVASVPAVAHPGALDGIGPIDQACFSHVSSSIARLSRRLEKLQEAVTSLEPTGELQRAARQAVRSLETYFWQVNNTCDKEQVRAGIELIKGKIRNVQSKFERSPFVTHVDVRSRFERSMEAWKELVAIVRGL